MTNVLAQVPPLPTPAIEKPTSQFNCIIQVSSFLKTGSTKVSYRKFHMKSKEKCEKMNRILSDNFSSKDVKKIETAMNWSENEK